MNLKSQNSLEEKSLVFCVSFYEKKKKKKDTQVQYIFQTNSSNNTKDNLVVFLK